ncbi:MAG: hypothetical protein J6Q41_03560 [Firmicutes bacterium]|nr:hypothetical protein [Bacillota bacterium]
MNIKKLSLKAFTVMMAFCLVLSLGFFALPDKASASTTVQIKSPTEDDIYFVNKKLTVKVYAGMKTLEPGYTSYMQVEILKSGNRVYFENKKITELADITFPGYTPKKTGKYTIKAGIVTTDTTPPNKVYNVKEKYSFSVKSASYVKEIKPTISAKRDGKKITITTTNRPAGVKMMVYRSTKSGSGYKKIKTVTANKYTDKVASSTKTYYYKIKFSYKPSTKQYLSKFSKVQTVKKVVKTTGDKINLKTPTYSSGKVKLTWDLVKGAGYYLIYKASSSTAEGEVISCNGEDENTLYDKDVKAGKTYYYWVEAYVGNDEKPSAKSGKVSIKIPS